MTRSGGLAFSLQIVRPRIKPYTNVNFSSPSLLIDVQVGEEDNKPRYLRIKVAFPKVKGSPSIKLTTYFTIFNRPGVAGAVLQSPPSLIN